MQALKSFDQNRQWQILGLLTLLVWLVYGQTASFEFVNYDDNDYVVQNPVVTQGLTGQGFVWAFTAYHAGNWHPVTWLSHMLDVELFGVTPGPHHLMNVVWHTFNTWLLFFWLNRVTGSLMRSALVAALFALHPTHVESVAWVSERKDLLSAFFGLVTLIFYTTYSQRRLLPGSSSHRAWTWYAAALVAFALGLMSKPMLVTWPLVLLLLDVWPLERVRLRESGWSHSMVRCSVEKIPFLLLSAASIVLTLGAQKAGGAVQSLAGLPLGERIANIPVSYARYLAKTVWPVELVAFYPHPGQWPTVIVIGCILLLAAISVAVLVVRRSAPWAMVGWFLFLGTLVPVIGLVQVGSQAMADRYIYLPGIGLYVILAWGGAAASRRLGFQSLFRGLGLLIALALAVAAYRQAQFWRSSETLFRRVVSIYPEHHIPRYLLGNSLMTIGKQQEGLEQLQKAVQFKPTFSEGLASLAFAYSTAQLNSEAVDAYRRAIELNPQFHQAMNNLAWLLATAIPGDPASAEEAIRWAQRACELTGFQQPSYIGTLAAAYAAAGQWDTAIACATQARDLALSQGNSSLAQANQALMEKYQQGQTAAD